MKAFTLFELLVVCAILALLAALMLPALTGAKTQARMTGDLSNLRQIGVARALYMTDHDEREVWSTIPLVQAGYLPQEMVRSPLDTTSIGMGNVSRRVRHAFEGPGIPAIETDYKDSYIALHGEVKLDHLVREDLKQRPGFGWLINSNNGRQPPYPQVLRTNPPRGWIFVGPYHRLLPDGAVVTRMMGLCRIPHGIRFIPYMAFADDPQTCEGWQAWAEEFNRRSGGG